MRTRLRTASNRLARRRGSGETHSRPPLPTASRAVSLFQCPHFGAGRRIENEFFGGDIGSVQFQFQHLQINFVAVLRPLDIDHFRKFDSVVVFPSYIGRVAGDVAVGIEGFLA